MAQLVARLVRNEKVGGSNPPSSTTGRHPMRMSVFCMPGVVLRCLVLCCSWRRWCSGRRIVCLWAWPLCVLVGGGPPARSPHASLTARSGRSRGPPWPCRRPPAPRPGPPDPPAPSTPVGPCVPTCGWARRLEARPGPAAAHRHRGLALRTLRRPPHLWGRVCRRVAGRLGSARPSASNRALSSISHAIPWHLQLTAS